MNNYYVVVVICYSILGIVRRARARALVWMETPSISKFHGCLLFAHLQFFFCLHDLINGFCEWARRARPYPSNRSISRRSIFHLVRCCGIQTKFQIVQCGVSYAAFVLLLLFVRLLPDRRAVSLSVCLRVDFAVQSIRTHISVAVVIRALCKWANSLRECAPAWTWLVEKWDCSFSIRSILSFNPLTRLVCTAIRNELWKSVPNPPRRIWIIKITVLTMTELKNARCLCWCDCGSGQTVCWMP